MYVLVDFLNAVYPKVNFNHEIAFPITTVAVVEKFWNKSGDSHHSLMGRGNLLRTGM